MSFGKRFSERRKSKKLTVEETSKSLGMSRSYIVLIEEGKRRPSPRHIIKIAQTFILPVNTVLNWYLEDMREKLQKQIKK